VINDQIISDDGLGRADLYFSGQDCINRIKTGFDINPGMKPVMQTG